MIDVKAFAKRIIPVPDAKDVWVKATIYGKSGVGKTRLALTKKTGHLLFANIEDGYLSLAGSGIDKVDLSSYADLQALYVYLKEGGHEYDTLFVDTFSQAHKFVLSGTVQEKIARNEAKNPYKQSLEDHGITTEKLRHWLWDMRALPMHIFYICLDRQIVREGDVQVTTTLALTQRLAEDLFAYSDFVGYLVPAQAKKAGSEEIVETNRLHLRSTGDFVAKVRVPVGVMPPESILAPTLDKIIALYRGAKKGEAA